MRKVCGKLIIAPVIWHQGSRAVIGIFRKNTQNPLNVQLIWISSEMILLPRRLSHKQAERQREGRERSLYFGPSLSQNCPWLCVHLSELLWGLAATFPSGLLTSSLCHSCWWYWNHCAAGKASALYLFGGKSTSVYEKKWRRQFITRRRIDGIFFFLIPAFLC